VALIRARFTESGLSQQAAEMACRGRRDSTIRVYSNRVGPFVAWCNNRGYRATSASVGQIADFLVEKFDSGLQASTVRGYRTAIQSIHSGFDDGSSLRENDAIRHLLNGMFNARPPARRMAPAWDLNAVLECLARPPFEPIREASLRNLTLKTVFLIFMSSGRRCSEIHALAVGGSMQFTSRGAQLVFRPGFLAKNERADFSAGNLLIPRIAMSSSVAEDRFWCPVRALERYVKVTKCLRGKEEQLFIITQRPHSPAAKVTLAMWVVELIQLAKAELSVSRLNCHSTRSVSTSIAFNRGVTLREVVDAVSWKSGTTFSTTYLCDLAPLGGSFAPAVLSARGQKTH
jgi:hypothetical protein